jgi:hypothetical protein
VKAVTYMLGGQCRLTACADSGFTLSAPTLACCCGTPSPCAIAQQLRIARRVPLAPMGLASFRHMSQRFVNPKPPPCTRTGHARRT